MSERTKKRTSRAEWFDAALRVLGEEGIHGVRVERLARDLGTSKSGFYWHFRDRRDLETQLLDYWAHEFTEVLALNVELGTLEPVARLSRVAHLVTEHDLSRYDLAVMAWAEHDELAAASVERVNRMRVEFTERALSELGITGDELALYSRLFVSYVSWDSKLLPEISKRKRTRLYQLLISLITETASHADAAS